MTVTTNLSGADNYVLQATISAYSDEAYTNAKKLSGTGIVGSNPDIDPSTETFIGQVRWYKPLNPTVNVASLTNAANGTTTSYSSDYYTYIKTVRTHGANKVNMQQVVTQVDGLAKIGRDFAETRAQDEHNALLSVLKGVAISELMYGAGAASGQAGLGGQTFDNDPTDKRYGFYVDMGASKPVIEATNAVQGAARAEAFLQAFGKAYKDYEPEYAYLVTSPEVMASLRSANLVDSTMVSDGNVEFSTIFNGKFRLIQTRAAQSLSSAELTKINGAAGINVAGTKTSFIVLPGALAMAGLAVPEQTEIYRDGRAYQGGGATSIWYRWGYVMHPAGYNWAGSQDAFPADADYMKVVEAGAPVGLTAATDGLADTTGVWTRKATSALSLGILPVFHA
ncbi:hypothetical protein [Flavobacterium sp.]|jgi:hypothetical protein|uniref:hypothetical protein n=1 Tax=Flavobacterium sp. TaxID=239 RepID=UPI0037BE4453